MSGQSRCGQAFFDEGYTKTNVFAKLTLPKATQRVVDVLSEDEIKRLLEGINPNTFQGARMCAILTLPLDTGMRIGELDRIAFEDKITGKGDKERLVPFGVTTSKAILRWYNQYREEDGDGRLFQWIITEADRSSTCLLLPSD